MNYDEMLYLQELLMNISIQPKNSVVACIKKIINFSVIKKASDFCDFVLINSLGHIQDCLLLKDLIEEVIPAETKYLIFNYPHVISELTNFDQIDMENPFVKIFLNDEIDSFINLYSKLPENLLNGYIILDKKKRSFINFIRNEQNRGFLGQLNDMYCHKEIGEKIVHEDCDRDVSFTFVDLAAFFGAKKCYNYLLLNSTYTTKVTLDTVLAAAVSGNIEIYSSATKILYPGPYIDESYSKIMDCCNYKSYIEAIVIRQSNCIALYFCQNDFFQINYYLHFFKAASLCFNISLIEDLIQKIGFREGYFNSLYSMEISNQFILMLINRPEILAVFNESDVEASFNFCCKNDDPSMIPNMLEHENIKSISKIMKHGIFYFVSKYEALKVFSTLILNNSPNCDKKRMLDIIAGKSKLIFDLFLYSLSNGKDVNENELRFIKMVKDVGFEGLEVSVIENNIFALEFLFQNGITYSYNMGRKKLLRTAILKEYDSIVDLFLQYNFVDKEEAILSTDDEQYLQPNDKVLAREHASIYHLYIERPNYLKKYIKIQQFDKNTKYQNMTPLIYAIHKSLSKSFKIILGNPDVDQLTKDGNGLSIIELCYDWNFKFFSKIEKAGNVFSLFNLFLIFHDIDKFEHRDDLNYEIKDKDNKTILHYISANGTAGFLNWLILKHKQIFSKDFINSKDNEGNTALHIAVKKKSVSIINILQKFSNIDVNTINIQIQTPLHLATKTADFDFIKKYVETFSGRIDFSIVSIENQTPLHIAISQSDIKSIGFLADYLQPQTLLELKEQLFDKCLSKGDIESFIYYIDIFDFKQRHLLDGLILAVEKNNKALVDNIIENYQNTMKSNDEQTNEEYNIYFQICLKIAIRNDQKDYFDIFIRLVHHIEAAIIVTAIISPYPYYFCKLSEHKEKTANNNTKEGIELFSNELYRKDGYGKTPLELCFQEGNIKNILDLMNFCDQIDLSLADKDGKTIFHYVRKIKEIKLFEQFLKVIIDQFRKVNKDKIIENMFFKDKKDSTIFHCWEKKKNKEMLHLLLKNNCFDMKEQEKMLHYASFFACKEGLLFVLTEILSSYDLNINQKNDNDYTILHEAASHNQYEIISIILDRSEIDFTEFLTEEKVNPLHVACLNGCVESAQVLIGSFDVNSKECHGYTPLIIASYEGQIEVVRFLLTIEGIDIEAKDEDDKTALQYAENPEIQKMLS